MNTSIPVSSFISEVSYGFLSREDIRRLSARRITSAVTLDTLLNPVSGGLYSAELGQFGDNACATCGLRTPQCPGHCGHIELPVPCYHPTFLDQILRLLRATCVYCNKLKMRRVEVNRYICKLQLLRHGLLQELKDLDDLDTKLVSKGLMASTEEEADSDAEDQDNKDVITEARLAFVKKALDRAGEERNNKVRSEAVSAVRRVVVQEFLAAITKSGKCHNCGGVGYKYRKDRFVKIFRKTLNKEQQNKMIQLGLKVKDPVIALAKRKREGKDHPRKRIRQEDEGIADMDRSSEEEQEETSESDEDVEIAGGDSMILDAAETKATKQTVQETYLNPSRVLAQLNELFIFEQPILALLYGRAAGEPALTADMFFIHDVIVPPNRYRPETRQGKDDLSEALENSLYKSIITTSDTLTTIQRELKNPDALANPQSRRYRARTYVDFENAWVNLQDAVNSMIDKDRNPITGPAAKRQADGVKQKLEKKQGLFRKNMMGKRVNFAARTVISPDPNIETNEIGVPPVFALKLTYPEPVTMHNLEELQEAVRNGPHLWPGATAIETEDGPIISLERKNAEERTALANQLLAPSVTNRGARPKKVYRHLNNGDIVIMNRQPTLHKPSMMCHRVRVLPGEKTLRMHYANCNTYNADFDGDEMNMHFPQNEVARAEALTIADTDHQYLSATAGNPLRGLIQDHISICVILTSRDTFFERGDYMQLLYAALRPEAGQCTSGRLETLPPAIIRPKALWTGKQVITSIMKNIVPTESQGLTMAGKSKTSAKFWSAQYDEEERVIFQDGYLTQGILDKSQIGPAAGGFVHSVYEVYGHTIAGRLLSILGRLLTKLLHMRAHSCGVADLIFSKEGELKRRDALKDSTTAGRTVASRYVSLDDDSIEQDAELKRRLEDVLRDDKKHEGLDKRMKAAMAQLSSAVTMACLPAALVKPFPRNQMQLMTGSGAKGTEVNANQISCNLGQQVLEGRRVPVMVSGKTLPCFKPFEPSARAGGYIVDRFLTGVRPQEFFFHAMSGREGLIDTAVKTSRSGYLQRCIVKGMEGLKVQHDTSVRDADGSVVQFLYGEDGLDIAKAKYLDNLTFAAQNYLSLTHSLGMTDEWARIMSAEAREATKAAEKRYRKTGDLAASDPAISSFYPAQHAGAISERVFSVMRDYLDQNPDDLLRDKKKGIEGTLTKKKFQSIVELRYLRSIVEAGEAVGVVAGQSIGEPSTQMTLNTFHLAGHATKNVTLGIPRLRELIMTAAANISTPLMTLRLNEMSEDDAKKFAKGISKLSLAEILDKVSIREKIGQGIAYTSAKIYEVKLELFPKEEYVKEYAITVEDIIAALEHRFLPRLQTSVRKEMSKRGEEKTLKTKSKSDAMPDIGKSAGAIEQHSGQRDAERIDGADDSDVDDGDATADKSKANQRQGGYDDLEDDAERDLAAANNDSDDEATPDETYHSQGSDDSDAEDDIMQRREAAEELESRIKSNRVTSDVATFKIDSKGETCVFTLEYAAETAKVLMLNLVEKAARAALVQSVPGISSAEYDPGASQTAKAPVVVAEGSNVRAMWDYQHIIHPHYLYTNSVHEILTTYGVEAARSAIHRELQSVFGGHGISVDSRHLTLIADYMTRGGDYSPFNRNGYRSNTSPFMKMSFETTVAFLRDAVLDGDSDDLTNPSARIVVGRMNNVGTGGFDVFYDLSKKSVSPDTRAEIQSVD